MALSLKLACFLFLIRTPLFGGERISVPPGRFSFIAHGAAEGLTNLAIQHLLQDRQGFLWVGSEAGLFRYEGARFEAFALQNGLPSSEITALFEDDSGILWVGTRMGLAQWNGRSFQAVPQQDGLPGLPILGIGTGEKGLLVACASGLYEQRTPTTFSQVQGWKFGEATALWARKSQDSYWVAAWQERPFILCRRGGSWQEIAAPSILANEKVDGLQVDAEGRVWARTARSLSVLQPGAANFLAAATPLPVVSARGYLSQDGQGSLWVPTDLGVMEHRAGLWTVLGPHNGLPFPWSRTAMRDAEGSVWVASASLVRMLGRGAWQAYTQADGLPNEVLWHITRLSSGHLVLGTDKGATIGHALGWSTIEGTRDNVVRSIAEAPDGSLVLAGFPVHELLVVPHPSARAKAIPMLIDPPPRRIFRIHLDGEGTLWIATDGAGLWKTTFGQWDFAQVPLPGTTMPLAATDVRADVHGRLWVTTQQGVFCRQGRDWLRIGKAEGLVADQVAGLTSLKNGDLLFHYSEPLGISVGRLDENGFAIRRHIDGRDGLSMERVYLTGEDAAGRIWVGTGRGVDLIDEKGVQHFDRRHGLVSEDCDNMAFLAEPDGPIWIGTSAGLAYFDPTRWPQRPTPPQSRLLSLQLGDQLFSPADEEVQISKDQNTFEVRFAGLSFLDHGSVQHRTRLRGLEEQWHISATRTERYPGLSKGAFSFEVEARIGQGDWGPSATFSFTILPAWWETWWFRLALALLFAALIARIVQWRLSALKKYNAQLEELVRARTGELAQANQALETANSALRQQSLTDPLTGLRNRRFLGECMPDDVAQVTRTHQNLHGKLKERVALNIDLLFIMADLDHFKSVNDEHGHHAGDLVLRQVSEILRQATRNTDTVVRWGGEEFLVVARNACRLDFSVLVERIRHQVENHPFDIGEGMTLHRTCSLGFAFFPFLPETPEILGWEQIVDLADQCLYAAKRGGRNAWVGLCPTEDLQEGDLAAHWPDVAKLLDLGKLRVRTSLPDPSALNWHPDHSS